MTTKKIFDLMKEELEINLVGELFFDGDLIRWKYIYDEFSDNSFNNLWDIYTEDNNLIEEFFNEKNIDAILHSSEQEGEHISFYIEI